MFEANKTHEFGAVKVDEVILFIYYRTILNY